MPIRPDTKDWTWVLHEPCPECGFDGPALSRDDVPRVVRENVAAWPAVLARADATTRPDDSTWSPLEYACHVRDVFRLFAERLELMRTREDPTFPNWDQDVTAVEERYGEQDPATVASELVAAGNDIAHRFAEVGPAEWSRTGRRSNGTEFTIESFARYFVHDVVHHLHDVRRG